MNSRKTYLENRLSPKIFIFVLIYYIGIFSLSYFFDIRIKKIAILIIFFPLCYWISLDIFWHVAIIFGLTFWKYYYFMGSRTTLAVSYLSLFIPIALLGILVVQFKNGKRIFDLKNQKTELFLIISILLSTIFAQDRFRSIIWILVTGQTVIIYFFLRNLLHNKERYKQFYLILIYSTIIPILFCFKDFLSNSGRIYGIFNNPNEVSAIMAFAIFLGLPLIFLSKRWLYQIFGIIYMIIPFIVILGTQSKGGQLAIMISLFVYFLFRRKNLINKIAFSVFFLLGVLLLYFSFRSTFFNRFAQMNELSISELDRIGMWIAAWKLFKQSPIIGVGLNNYYNLYIYHHPFFFLFNLNQFTIAHNLFLNTLAEMGLVGFSALILIIRKIGMNIKNTVQNKNKYIKEIGLTSLGFFCYWFLHNFFDCPWTAYAHEVTTLTFVFFLMFLNLSVKVFNRSE